MKNDSVTKDYMNQSTIFADAFNFLLYKGETVIRPENLSALDPTEIGIIQLTNDKSKQEQMETTQKYRDVLKAATVMTDENATYLILGIENQNLVHYAMPVRNGLYDFLQYDSQVRRIAQKHRKEKDWKDRKAKEYLSGFYKEDRLTPVITLVIYFQPTPWDGPRTLSEMFRERPPQIRKYMADYRINLIEPAALTEEELGQFHTELGMILKFLKESNDKDSMYRLMHEDQNYRRISREGANLLSVCAGIKIKRTKESEVVDVCKAVDDMIKDAVEEKERTMCKAIDGMIKDAVEEKEREIERLWQLLVDERCRRTGCSQEAARLFVEQMLV